jgi:hypothetical protein
LYFSASFFVFDTLICDMFMRLFQINTGIIQFQYYNYEISKKEINKVMVNGVNLIWTVKEFLCDDGNNESQ